MNNSIFETIKNTISKEQFKDFIAARYGIEFKGNGINTFCPFHSHNHDTPSLGITDKGGSPFFHCFACHTSGDIVKFVELKDSLSALQAAAIVCDHFGIPHNIHGEPLSAEQIKEQQEKLAKINAENEARRAAEAKQREAKAKMAHERVKGVAPILLRDLANAPELTKPFIKKAFPFDFSPTFEHYARDILGYSHEHRSMAIIIRDEKGEPVNIRYREKFIWDKKLNQFSSERMSGKWIGESAVEAYPFPLRYFLEHKDERVIVCEGEKDALNLLSLNARCLTLGGVNSSFAERAEVLELLRDKEVYIWFDHDEAGYLSALNRYNELKNVAKSVYIVAFFALTKGLTNKYDISDYIYDNVYKFNDDKTSIFDIIAFSSFSITDRLLDEIGDYFPNLKNKLNVFRPRPIIRHFDEIEPEFLATDADGKHINIFNVKGELDDAYIDRILDNAKNLRKDLNKKNDRFEILKENYIKNFLVTEEEEKNFDRFAAAFDELFKIQKTVRTNYHQTHIIDMVNSFADSLIKMGYLLAQYKSELYFWTKTHFARLDLNTLSHFIQAQWMERACVDVKKSSVKNAKEIIENLHNRAYLLDHVKREETRRIINFKNGTGFVSKNGIFTFKPRHNRQDGALNILDFNYDPKATCPKWNRFLSQVLPDEKERMSLMEFIGYCFLPSHRFETFLFLYGKSGANGKSVILDTIRAFFGEENISSLQLQQFEGHKTAALVNKILNIGSEIDKNGMDKGQMAILKTLVSANEYVQIDPKNKDTFSLSPNEKPKLAFSGNEKPRQGLDGGVFRRMLFITFDKEIKDDQKIRDLSERFSDELAGILNLALEGLLRLITRGKFTRSARMLNELEEYKDDVNPIRAFARDAVVADNNYMVPKQYLYALYKAYITEKGGTPLKDQRFYTALRDELLLNNIVISKGQKRLKANYIGLTTAKPYCVFGIKINEDIEFDTVSIDGKLVQPCDMNIYQAGGAKADKDE